MIRTYSFFESDVNKLNDFVLAFFNRIEFENGDFSDGFFDQEFYDNLVCRHTGILRGTLKKIYEKVKRWKQPKRTALCEVIRQSNELEDICSGSVVPSKADDIPEEIRTELITLFKKLYTDVLFGKYFKPHYGNRKSHYHLFRRHGVNEYSYCPSCGIFPMHSTKDEITDQYDHYLPKDLYPFSSVNFKNLVPVCNDCNSIQVKSDDDILSHTGRVFYPFDESHQPIEITISIKSNAPELEDIEWKIDYSCQTGKTAELTAWKAIYKIESRHMTHAKGNVISWHKRMHDYLESKSIKKIMPDIENRKTAYLVSKENGDVIEHEILEQLIIEGKAHFVSKQTSRYSTD